METENDVQAIFANRLKAKRKELRWTQKETSEKIGVNLRTYQYWELTKGGKLPRPAILVRVAQMMNCPVSYFYGGEYSAMDLNQDKRTVSVHKEHTLLIALESAGLDDTLVDKIITSPGNDLAIKLVKLIRDDLLVSSAR